MGAGEDFNKSPVQKVKTFVKQLASNHYAWAPRGANSVKSAEDTEMMNLFTFELDALTQEVRIHGKTFYISSLWKDIIIMVLTSILMRPNSQRKHLLSRKDIHEVFRITPTIIQIRGLTTIFPIIASYCYPLYAFPKQNQPPVYQ